MAKKKTKFETTMDKDKKILVCDKCFQASCIKGIFYCDESRYAGTTYKTVEELLALGEEHPSYWKDKDNEN